MTTIVSTTRSAPFKFTDDLDPAQFHCVRYIGAPLTGSDFDKTAVYYFFESERGAVKFVAHLALTWTEGDKADSVLILPFWMKKFDFEEAETVLKFTKISNASEFSGTLRLELFNNLGFVPLEEVLPELLGKRRPLCNGTVLPFVFCGKRFLLKVQGDGIDEGKVFWFNLENGTFDIKNNQKTIAPSGNLDILLNGSWSDEFKILKYHLNEFQKQPDNKKIILICGVPVPFQEELFQVLRVERREFDVSSLIYEEHFRVFEEDGGIGEEAHKEDKSIRFCLIGEIDKMSPNLITEIVQKLKGNSIMMSSLNSIDSSAQLVHLEKSARRFNFQLTTCSFPAPTETERIEIVKRESGISVRGGDEDTRAIREYKWTLNSLGLVDLMRLGRVHRAISGGFKEAIEIIKGSGTEINQLYSVFSGKPVRFPFYGYKKLCDELKNLIKGPLINPEAYERFGLPKSSGFLLHGPSGCGKTSLCLHILTSQPFNAFFTVFHVPSASQLLSKYFGETEANIRKLFAQARERKPAIIFIDQIETLGRKRGLDSSTSSDANDRYLSTLLNEMDGISGNEGVSVIACANEIKMLDEALLRPGRLDRHFFMDTPDAESRSELIEGFGGNLAAGLLEMTEGWTGAEIKLYLKQ